MKNLTILLLLMMSSFLYSQPSKVYVYVNVDSAEVQLDEIYQGKTLKGLPMIVEVKKGEHEIVVRNGVNSTVKQSIRVEKGDSAQVFCTFRDVVSVPSQQDEKEEPVFLVVEDPATFNGKDLSSFRKWVAQNIHYPEQLSQKCYGGKLYVQFIVNAEGKIENAHCLAGFDNEFDEEAIRVIRSSPQWKPARQGGRTVKQLFTIPIVFNPWQIKK